MQLADRSSTRPINESDSPSLGLSGLNQSVYQRLKKTLSLNLRRQIFLAVCDDLSLRNRLAAQLYAELAYPAQTTNLSGYPLPASQLSSRPTASTDLLLTDSLAVEPTLSLLYPRLVSLNLNLSDPDPIAQVMQWLVQYPPPKGIHQQTQPPGFQILGIERLTRQPACAQKQFLTTLQQIEKFLPDFEFSLLLWLPRPWLHAVQQSAPAFWNWRTALFEFEGDPTPVPRSTFTNAAESTPASTYLPPTQSSDQLASRPRPSTSQVDQPGTSPNSDEAAKQKNPAFEQYSAAKTPFSSTHPAHSAPSSPPTPSLPISREDIWDILTHDLAQLKDGQSPLSEQNGAKQEPKQAEVETPFRQVLKASSERQSQPKPSPKIEPAEALQGYEDLDTAVSADPPSPISLPYPPHSIQDLANLVLAIAMQEEEEENGHADLIQALEYIQQLHLHQGTGAELAAAYQNLGNLYRDRVEQGDDSESTLMVAICAYELVLQWLDASSPLNADVLNDIGNLYWMLSRGVGDLAKAQSHLGRAIAAYESGLSCLDPQVRPQNYSMIQNNLGSAFGDLARYGAPAEALEQSVKAYEAALLYRRLEDDPARYAATQNNLGTAYWNLAQYHQPVLCLGRAIAAYNEALHYYSPDREPLYYAMIQNNLGTAYWNLAQHKQSAPDAMETWGEDGGTQRQGDRGRMPASPAEWLHQAIAAYRAALTYRTMEVGPAAYAATQNNLGTAHWHLANLSDVQPGDRREHLQAAIAAYHSALTAIDYLSTDAAPSPALTFDPAATHNNLGLAYHQIAIDKHIPDEESQRSANLESALEHHLQALQGWQQNPDYYQTVLGYVIQTVRTFYSEHGMKGQNLALSKLPPQLLPEIMKRL